MKVINETNHNNTILKEKLKIIKRNSIIAVWEAKNLEKSLP